MQSEEVCFLSYVAFIIGFYVGMLVTAVTVGEHEFAQLFPAPWSAGFGVPALIALGWFARLAWRAR